MKRFLSALAAGLACLSAAQAQASNVQITGLADIYVGSFQLAGQQRENRVGSGGMSTSWWGFQGSEDLGNGLKIDFKLTAFMRADTGDAGRFAGDSFFARDANIGLSGDFGALRIGRDLAPNFLPTIQTNPFGNSFTISPLGIHGNARYGNRQATFMTTPADTGWSNEIIYTTPKIGGLVANLHYQFGEQAGRSGKKNMGGNLLYGSGPLNLTAFYERAQVANPLASLMPTKTDWMVGGSYDLGAAKLYATYGQSKGKDDAADLAERKNKTASLGLDVPVPDSHGTLKAAVARTTSDKAAEHLSRTTVSVGYDHFLSKRTDLYAVAMHDRVTRETSGTSVVLGIRHRF